MGKSAAQRRRRTRNPRRCERR